MSNCFRRLSLLRFRCEFLERRDCPAGFSLTAITADATVTEGNAAEFRITMDAASPIPQAVMVSTKSLTASLGSDYMFRTQRITFFPGETEKLFSVQSLRDPVEATEGAETLQVFVRPIGGTPEEISALMTIDDYVPPAQFTITFNFSGNVPQSVINASSQAAARWTEIIVGDLPDVVDPVYGIIDDILIIVQMGLLPDGTTDGDGNTLANARPLSWRGGGTGLPYLAEVGVDPADADRGDLLQVMIHEFGHALGFPGTASFQSDLEGTYFTGRNAVREYRSLFGAAADPLGVPMETEGGAGTQLGHWSEAEFGNELMTGYINPGGNPLSRITVGAFDDIGYTVNYAAADPYRPPAGLTGAAGGATNSLPGRIPLADIMPGLMPVAPSSPTSPPTRSPATAAPPSSPPPDTAEAITPTVHARPGRSSSGRALPPRITLPGQAPTILSDDDVSRQLVMESLAAASGAGGTVHQLDLRHLNASHRALLTAWAAYGQATDPSGTASHIGPVVLSGMPTTRQPAFRSTALVFTPRR